MAPPPPPRRGKKNTATTVWPPPLSLLLLMVLAVLLITPPVHSRPQQGSGSGRTSSSTISGQKGSDLRAWRRDAIRPDRRTDRPAPPAPEANSNVPGGPFG